MTAAQANIIMTENATLKAKVSTICKVYTVVRPVLKVVRVFAFIKKGGRAAIDGAIAVLDSVCEVE